MATEISVVKQTRERVGIGQAVRFKEAFVTEDDRIRIAAIENRDSIFAQARMNEIIVIQKENVFAAGMFQTVVAGRANPWLEIRWISIAG